MFYIFVEVGKTKKLFLDIKFLFSIEVFLIFVGKLMNTLF